MEIHELILVLDKNYNDNFFMWVCMKCSSVDCVVGIGCWLTEWDTNHRIIFENSCRVESRAVESSKSTYYSSSSDMAVKVYGGPGAKKVPSANRNRHWLPE